MTWHRRCCGTTGRDDWEVVVEPDAEGWERTGLYAGRLADGETRTRPPTSFSSRTAGTAG